MKRLTPEQRKKLAEELRVSDSTIRRKEQDPKFEEWVREMKWRRKHDVSPYEKIWKKGTHWVTASIVARRTGLKRKAVMNRIKYWYKGIITYQRLMNPRLLESTNKKEPKKEKRVFDRLHDEEAERRLKQIPGLTEYERKHYDILFG